MRHTRPILAALVALATATAGHAQIGLGNIANTADTASKNFDIADKNHDGLLSKEEAEKGPVPFIRAHFDKIDKEHRGLVSKQDVKDYFQALNKKPDQKPAPAAASSGY